MSTMDYNGYREALEAEWIAKEMAKTGSKASLIVSENFGAPVRKIVSGRYYGAGPHAPLTLVTSQSRLVLTPIWAPKSFNIDSIEIEVTAAVAATVVRLGIYANDPVTDMPSTLMLDAGTVDSATIGVKALAISATLAQGWNWLGACAQGGNPTIRSIGNNGQPPVQNTVSFNGVSELNGYQLNGITGALPTNFTGTLTVGSSPRIMVKAV